MTQAPPVNPASAILKTGVIDPNRPQVERVYELFSALFALAKERFDEELGGKLLLYRCLDAEGAAVALAANIAGAATLGVDADGERLKQGIRWGFCDFLVNGLDEALRILKNEIRKKQPVSVCLQGDFGAALFEIVERGLQPDLLAFAGHRQQAAVLIERGAVVFPPTREPDVLRAAIAWSAQEAPALWLPKVDALAASALAESDERLRWLKLAPRYLGRTMAARRYIRMTAAEAERFQASVAAAIKSGAIGAPISVTRL